VSGFGRTGRTGTSRLSLRARVLVGAVLWTVGLLTVACVIGIVVLLGHPIQHAFAIRTFYFHPGSSLVVAAVCMVLGFWQVRKGLSALDDVRAQLAAVRDGRERQIAGRYPAEVEPLITDLNALLEHRDHAVRRAVAKAGDLAHGLKTPLAVLAQEAARAGAAGHRELAESIEQQVDRMRRQVDYHLAQARAAASGATPGARCAVADSAEPLARTLHRLHAERPSTLREPQGRLEHGRGATGSGRAALTIDVNAAPEHVFRGQREDLDEMLGNLLDNACKWARSRVVITSAACDGHVVVTVDDDGPGLDGSMREAVLHRGVRADEAAPGSGLGLAIVRDLAEVYGGSIALDASPLGGLRARLQLPGS
jgi:signal transduction histidine kinase